MKAIGPKNQAYIFAKHNVAFPSLLDKDTACRCVKVHHRAVARPLNKLYPPLQDGTWVVGRPEISMLGSNSYFDAFRLFSMQSLVWNDAKGAACDILKTIFSLASETEAATWKSMGVEPMNDATNLLAGVLYSSIGGATSVILPCFITTTMSTKVMAST